MGLPGSGKTTLANELATLLEAKRLNADEVRKEANDWDFSEEGRVRQSKRMRDKALKLKNNGFNVIVDFVCPTPETRKQFPYDKLIFMDTIKESRFQNTNKIFIPPKKFSYKIIKFDYKNISKEIAKNILWDNKKPTAQMLGRWQPFHDGHYTLFKEIIKKTGQVCIQIRDVQGVDDNPFDFETVKKNIEDRLNPEFIGKFKIMLVPNITNICYGRGVGYKIEEIVLDEETQKISATKIRAQMRAKGKLLN